MWSTAALKKSPTSPTFGRSRAMSPRATPTGSLSQPKPGNSRSRHSDVGAPSHFVGTKHRSHAVAARLHFGGAGADGRSAEQFRHATRAGHLGRGRRLD